MHFYNRLPNETEPKWLPRGAWNRVRRGRTVKKSFRGKRNGASAAFAIIRYNLRTYEPGGVMAIIKGRGKAEVTVQSFESGQSREDGLAGWGYFLEKTDLKPGMDPQKATSLRQMRMDIRESEAQVATLTLAAQRNRTSLGVSTGPRRAGNYRGSLREPPAGQDS